MKKTIKDSSLFVSSFATEAYSDLFKFLEHTTPREYDKIMDQVYNSTHIGGGGHRSFDGSHTISGSWDKIKAETGDVDFGKFINAHFNELVTPEGIPLFNLDKGSYDQLSNEIADSLGPNVNVGDVRGYFRDINSVNLGEVGVAGLGFAFMAAAIYRGDSKAISRVAASNLCLGICTGNPFQIITGLSGVAHGVYTGKIKSLDLLRGAAPTLSGVGAYYVAGELFKLGKGSSLILSLGAGVATNFLIDKLESDKQKLVIEELGENPSYHTVMTPAILGEELKLLARKNGNFMPSI